MSIPDDDPEIIAFQEKMAHGAVRLARARTILKGAFSPEELLRLPFIYYVPIADALEKAAKLGTAQEVRQMKEVFVVVAYNTDTERMTDANVLTDLSRAQEVFANLKIIYGGANVAMFSRFVDSVHMGAPIRIEDLE